MKRKKAVDPPQDCPVGTDQNYFLQVIPTLTHYFDIGCFEVYIGICIYIYIFINMYIYIYLNINIYTYVLTLYLTFFLAYTFTFFLAFYLASILT